MENLTDLLVLGVPISIVAPMVVQMLKGVGLPTSLTGIASVIVCLVLAILTSAAAGELSTQNAATYILQGLVYGLAGNGVYSQAKLLTGGS